LLSFLTFIIILPVERRCMGQRLVFE
jgi:hypothetical protein